MARLALAPAPALALALVVALPVGVACGGEPLRDASADDVALPPAVSPDPSPHDDDDGPRAAPDRTARGDDQPLPGDDDDDIPLEPLRDPGALGPYAVGVRTVEIEDASRDRTLKVDVWYPVDASAPDGGDNAYEIEMPLIGTISEIESPARRNATPLAPTASNPGGWPLVVFSHGYGGVRFQSIFITEHLASHGFVVASPDHPGNTLGDTAQLGSDEAAIQSSIDRPLDMALLMTELLTPSSALVAGLTIDGARIGATGHSFGAWTALELARQDARIGAVFPMAPGFRQGSTPDFVATLARPLLIIGGSVDDTCEFPENQQLPYDLAQTPKHLLEVMGAGHLDFSDLCQVPIARLFVDDGCDPGQIDPAVVHERVRHVSTAFALRFIAGDERYDTFLADDAVAALGNVSYWSEP